MYKPKILVVEDDPAITNLIRTTLDTQEYQYHTAKNGAGALLDAVSYNPDVIILDLGLPDMDGVEIIRKVRGWSSVPIIIVSARSEDQDKVEALDAGADDYLTKPFSIDEFLARLRVALRRSRTDQTAGPSQSSLYQNGELRIDYAAGCAYMGGKEIHLTPIEYKLLCVLAKKHGKGTDAQLHSERGVGNRPCRRYPFPARFLWPPCAKRLNVTHLPPGIFRPTLALGTG